MRVYCLELVFFFKRGFSMEIPRPIQFRYVPERMGEKVGR